MLDFRIYNTLTRQVEVFTPRELNTVRLYVCGPTVYDEAHLGHARCYLTWDVLVRFLQWMGYDVLYTRNITDVDDKILARAAENNESPQALAERYTERFHTVMHRLNTLPPTHEPRATAYIPQMITLIAGLLEKEVAYRTPSGTIYYDVTRHPGYGSLCHQDLGDLQSGARVDVDPEKRSPLDFALWKPAPPTEPCVWEAPWGPGRPGWHIECSAMGYSLLGDQLDIHAGGMDLIFPHHQNELAQSEAFTGVRPFVRYWMHNGFVNVSGEKMSKSLGNFATVEALLQLYDANTLRYFVLTQHYRSPMDFNDFALAGARNRVGKIARNLQDLLKDIGFPADALADAARARIAALSLDPGQAQTDWEQAAMRWYAAMAGDLNTAEALAHLNDVLSLANPKPGEKPMTLPALEPCALGGFLALADVMGLDFISTPTQADLDALIPDLATLLKEILHERGAPVLVDMSLSATQLIEAILTQRALARELRDWAMSDRIRDHLLALGIHLKDRRDGLPLWHFKPVTPALS